MNADDALFEPLFQSSSQIPLDPGITRLPCGTLVEISTSKDKALYIAAASVLIDEAVRSYPSLQDVRTTTIPVPAKCLNLLEITERFYDGDPQVWISCPKLVSPTSVKLFGRFGYINYFQFPQAHKPESTGKF